jgi:hypothetical protein
MPAKYRDKIGFSFYEGSLQFSNGGIYPLEYLKNIHEYVDKNANKDGFFCPNLTNRNFCS